jgi:hypothetical protein
MDSSQEEKQNFLREKILEKGYDTNQFVQFLIDKKGEDGADVGVWTMSDLKKVVREFIKLNGGEVEEEEPPKVEQKQYTKKISMFDVLGETKPKTQPQAPISIQKSKSEPAKQPAKVETQVQPQNRQNNETSSNPPINTSTNNNTNPLPNRTASITLSGNESEYGVIIPDTKKCKPCETTDIGKSQKVAINISKPEKKEGGFLKKAFMTYLISTYPVSYKVRRRYNDFTWLRTALQSHFPGNIIPPMPKRNRFGVDPFSEQFVSKRSRGLDKFLNYLAKDPIIKSSQLFFDFLYIGAEVDFNSKKKVYEKVKPVSDVQEFREEKENVNLLVTEEKESYLENIKDNTNININLFKKLNISFKLLYDEMNNVINRMEEISKTWEQIYKASEKYFDNNTTCESYKQMSNLFKTWSNVLKEQNNTINVDIREHFKFIRKNFASMKDLASSIDTHKYNYQKSVKNLMSKKEDLFKRGDPSKWELDPKNKLDFSLIAKDKKTAVFKMCPKETSNVINLKEFYGYFLNRAISEYERMRNLNGTLNKDIITTNINKLTQISGKFHTCIAEINSALDAAALNKSNDQKCQLKRIPLDESYLK